MEQLLMPKNYFLRLNLEQVQHIVDGIAEKRTLVDPASLPLYDGEMNNVLHQLNDQGIQIEFLKKEPLVEGQDVAILQTMLADAYSEIMCLPVDLRGKIFTKVQQIEQHLFE